MSAERLPVGGIRITDGDGDSSLFTPIGDDLIINATSADQEMQVNLLVTGADLAALLAIVPEDALSAALVKMRRER